MKRQWPKLWPEWADLVDVLSRAGIDLESRPDAPLHEQGVAFWLDRLAETPVTREQVGVINGIVTDVIEGMRK